MHTGLAQNAIANNISGLLREVGTMTACMVPLHHGKLKSTTIRLPSSAIALHSFGWGEGELTLPLVHS